MFPIFAFLARQILGIVGSQIEIKRIFSFVDILTNIKKYHLQTNNLERLIFMSKYWPNDFRVGSFPNNLVKLIKANVEWEEELEEFEGSFDRNEIVDM
jgi:hypothetical protein